MVGCFLDLAFLIVLYISFYLDEENISTKVSTR